MYILRLVAKPYEVLLKDFPFGAKEAVYAPILYRYGIEMKQSVPFPSPTGIRDLNELNIEDSCILVNHESARIAGSNRSMQGNAGESMENSTLFSFCVHKND